MAQAYTYAQASPATAGTGNYFNVYNVTTSPATKQAVISSLVICNTGSVPVTYRIGLTDTAVAPTLPTQFLVYDQIIQPNFTIALTLGIAMPNGKYLRASASQTHIAFTAFVSEIT